MGPRRATRITFQELQLRSICKTVIVWKFEVHILITCTQMRSCRKCQPDVELNDTLALWVWVDDCSGQPSSKHTLLRLATIICWWICNASGLSMWGLSCSRSVSGIKKLCERGCRSSWWDSCSSWRLQQVQQSRKEAAAAAAVEAKVTSPNFLTFKRK